MDPVALGIIGACLLVFLIMVGTPIAFSMALIGVAGVAILAGPTQAMSQLALNTWNSSSDFVLIALPLFVLMGQLVFQMGIARDMYESIRRWFGWMPGGLAVTAVVASAGFGAVTGVSAAAVATMGAMSMPELRRFGYSESLAAGSIAASGTLAILIPPSVLMIVYGIWTETSIGALFLAGILPGILLTAVFVALIVLRCVLNPALGPVGPKYSWAERIDSLKLLGPVLVIFGIVIGGIYVGFFTPTEASAIGVVGVLAVGFALRRVTRKGLVSALIETGLTSGMIFIVVIGGHMIARFFVLTNITPTIIDAISGSGLSPLTVLFLVTVMYLILGAILDVWGMLILTLPFTFPIMTALGFDAVWFGIFVVLMTELALITPPVGINVYIMKGIVPEIPIGRIFAGVMPFVLGIFIVLGLLVAFPDIALWLPKLAAASR